METQTTGSSDSPFTFVGKKGYYKDSESSLYLLGARYYDPGEGRFVSEDPIGFRGGDINLYRYAANNPVNHIDPSGKSILVPIEDVKDGGCAYRNAGRSDASDKLRDMIWEQARTWDPRTAINLPLLTTIYVGEFEWYSDPNKYKRVDLYNQLPAETWEKIETGGGDVKEIVQTGAAGHIEIFLNDSGELDWKEAEKPFLQQVVDLVDQLGGLIANVVSGLMDALVDLFKVAIAALTSAAGVNLGSFLDLMEQFGSYLSSLITNGTSIISSYIDGMTGGFQGFGKNFPQHAKRGVVEWLGLPEGLTETNITGNPLGALLEVVGLSLDDLLGIVRQAFEPIDFALILYVFEDLATKANDFVAWIQGAFDLVKEKLSSLKELVAGIFASVIERLKTDVWPVILQGVLAFLVPGANIIKLIGSLFKAGMWLWDNWQQIVDLWYGAIDAFATAVSSQNVFQVSKKIEGLLAKAIAPILSGLASILGLGNLDDKVREFAQGAKDKATKPVKLAVNCAGPNCSRIPCQIKRVLNFGLLRVFCRIVETFGEAEHEKAERSIERSDAFG